MKRFAFLLPILILFAFPSTVYADIAPPYNPPGTNLNPGSEATQVRMVAETVLINVQKDTTPGSLGRAHVTADFTMHNLGNASESMAVRFPIAANNGYDGSYPEITDVAIRVDGKQVPFRRASYPTGYGWSQDDLVPWAEFDVTFPVEQDVSIQVAYNLSGTGYSDRPYFTTFYYVLQTGAGWQGTIGSADIVLRLPYEANVQNVIFDQIGWGSTTRRGTFKDNEVRWHFEDFEPSPNGPVQDMEFALVAPAMWQSVLIERENVTRRADDGEAWGRLAKVYKEIFFYGKGYRTDAGGEEVYKSSIEAYEKSLSLDPNDAQWHAGFANLLAYHSVFGGTDAEAQRAIQEIHTALRLAPNDPKVLEVATDLTYTIPEGIIQNGDQYSFPWLTKTPTPVTVVPLFDLGAIPGTYQINPVFLNDKTAQLTFTLRSDFSADMETKLEDGQTYTASGSWEPSNLTIILSLVDQSNESTNFEFFVQPPPSNSLEVINAPDAFFFESQKVLIKIDVATARPTDTLAITPTAIDIPTNAPPPTAILLPTPVGEAVSPSQPLYPLWAVIALALLFGIVWLARNRSLSKK